jgi:hypothetical protein
MEVTPRNSSFARAQCGARLIVLSWRREESMTNHKSLPANFRRIVLELAREPQHPNGDARIGYVVVAPLGDDGKVDAETASAFKQECRFSRVRSGETLEQGFLKRRAGGSWAFHYALEDGREDDDPLYRLDEHRFATGEYVTIVENDGAHTYRVASIEPLPLARSK